MREAAEHYNAGEPFSEDSDYSKHMRDRLGTLQAQLNADMKEAKKPI